MRTAALLLAGALLTAGCGGEGPTGATPIPSDAATIALTSDAFSDGTAVPQRYSCDGAQISPPLAWWGVPADAASLVLLVTDPDAPDGEFVHWVLVGLTADSDGLQEGTVPDIAVEGVNDAGETGWTGPCPPPGDGPHRYVFTLLALDQALALDAGATIGQVRDGLGDRVVGVGQLTGTYER